MSDGPSIAALIVPWDAANALDRIGKMLVKQGLAPYAKLLPSGYRAAPNEWIGLHCLPLPGFMRGREAHPNASVVSTDVARIFELAMLVSAAYPDEVIVGWRRYAGFEPCAKIIWGGKPRWKQGEDADHEVGYVVPQGEPAELRPPSEAKVPSELAVVTGLLAPIVKPLKDPLAAGGAAWLSLSSMLR